MDGRHKRAAREKHQRDARCREVAALAGDLPGELLRHLAEHFGEVDAGLFEDVAFGQNARLAAATARAVPGILAELPAAVERLQFRADPVLHVAAVTPSALPCAATL